MTGVTPYLEWLLPGQRWLAENWGEEQTWDDVRAGFLETLGTGVAALDSPDMRLLYLVDLAAEQLGEHGRETLTGQAEFTEVVQQQFELWSQEQELNPAEPAADVYAAAEPAQAVEPAYIEGRGWMTYDAATGEWVDMAAPAPDELAAADPGTAVDPGAAEAPGAAATDEPTWVEGYGWMTYDATAGEWVVAPAPAGAAEPATEQFAEPTPERAPEPVPADVAGEPVAETASSESAPADAPSEEPPPAEPLPDLAPAAADAVDTAVMEEIAPVVEEAFEGVEDLDLFSPEELQDILAAALEESGLSE